MSTVLDPRAIENTLNNIPLNCGVGYGKFGSGRVYLPNGEFLLYGGVSLNADIDFSSEMISAANILLTEVPCDENGNILLKSNWMSHLRNESWPTPDMLTCFFLFTSEPTHRVNLLTGAITNNQDDGQYIRDILVMFGSGVWN